MQYDLVVFLVQSSIWFMEERSSNIGTPSEIMSTCLQLAMRTKGRGARNEIKASLHIVILTANL